VILGGLVELDRAAPNKAHLELAARIAKAAIKALSDDKGVIRDGCEPGCGGDASQFKGIFMRNLQQLQAVAPDKVYKDAIKKNADSVWMNNRDEEQGNVLSIDWAGPYVSHGNATTHSSAMDVLIAAASLGGK
jgi:predicted alpha-1,6-mannanase (GH76 family)